MSAEEATNPFIAKTAGKADTGSKAKAKAAHERTEQAVNNYVNAEWPRNEFGKPLIRISMAASELIPTGQYANVSVGPCQITAFIDPDREIGDEQDATYFTLEERATIAQASNELAEIVEGDVVAVQRNIVLESMQQQNES